MFVRVGCAAPRRDDGVKRARYSPRRVNGTRERAAWRGAARRGVRGNSGRFRIEQSGASFRGEDPRSLVLLRRDGTERDPQNYFIAAMRLYVLRRALSFSLNRAGP